MATSPAPLIVQLLVPARLADLPWSDVAAAASEITGILAQTSIVRGDVRDVLAELSADDRTRAVVYVSDTEDGALGAIESGADEALCAEAPVAAQLATVFRRAVLRAHRRFHEEVLHGAAVHADKLASLGTLVAGVAHEINNPCTVVVFSVDSLRDALRGLSTVIRDLHARAEAGKGISHADLREIVVKLPTTEDARQLDDALDDIAFATQTISHVVRDLRLFARSEQDEPPELFDVHELIEQVLRITSSAIQERGHIERDFAIDLPKVVMPRTRVTQVLTNLLANAAHALREIDRPVHRVRITTRADGAGIAIIISDTGPGIPDHVLPHIFDPFFTTKKAGVGTGLGLSLSAELVARVGGQIIAESEPGEGATFLVFLPAAREPEIALARPKDLWRPASGVRRRTVLVVDDDERLLRVYARVLRERYDVLLANDGQEAIDMLVSGSHADVIVTDLTMPEVDGEALVAWLDRERPDLGKRTVIVTAAEQHVDRLEAAGRTVLRKPVARDDLLRVIESLLAEPPPRSTDSLA